jgi:uncharacterized protein YjbJ (UPF0337 family)
MAKAKDPLGAGGTDPRESRITEFVDDRSSRIKSEIERTRASMDRTIEALGAQLNPRYLFDDILGFFRSDDLKSDMRRVAFDTVRKTLQKIREHPVPSVLAGAGLAYLMFLEEGKEKKRIRKREAELAAAGLSGYEVSRAGPQYAGFTEESLGPCSDEPGRVSESGIATAVSEAAGEGGEREAGPGPMQRAKEKMSDVAESAGGKMKETASRATDKVKHTASTVAEKMKGGASNVTSAIREMVSGAAHKVGDVAGITSAKAGELGGQAGHKARELSHQVRDRASEAGEKVRAGASDLKRQVRRGYDYSRDRAAEITDEYPLAVGAAMLGLGMLVGLMLPRTRSEDKLIGKRSDQLKRRAKLTGKEMVDRGMQIAQTTAEEAINEAKRQGLTPSAVADKAREAAAELKGAATGVAQREQLTPQDLAEKAKAVAEHTKETAQQELNQQKEQEQPKNLQETKV